MLVRRLEAAAALLLWNMTMLAGRNESRRKLVNTLKAGIQPFINTNRRIVADIWRGRRLLVLQIMALTIVSAGSRIGVLALLASAAQVLSTSSTISVLGYTFPLGGELQAVAVFAVAMGVVSIAGVVSTYDAERRMRAVGRWLQEQAVDRIDALITRPASHHIGARYSATINLNALITQTPMHYSLAGVTIIRMVNPIVLMISAVVLMFTKQPWVATGVFVGSLAFFPIFLSKSLGIQRNAREFYTERAMSFNKGLAQRMLLANSQWGSAPGVDSRPASKQKYTRDFLDALDKNMLANELILMIVSSISGVVMPIMILILGLLYSYGHFTLGGIITLVGTLIYLFTSVRTVASQFINLIRFYGQSRLYYDFLDGSDKRARTAAWPGKGASAASPSRPAVTRIGAGQIAIVSVERPLAKLSLSALLEPLLSQGALVEQPGCELYFVGSAYRFGSGSILDHLAGTAADGEARQRAVELCERFGVAARLGVAPRNLDEPMSEEVWAALDGPARAALRIIPLIVAWSPKIVVVDSAVLQGASRKFADQLLAELGDCPVIVSVPAGSRIPDLKADAYGLIAAERAPLWVSRESLEAVHPKAPSQAAAAADATLDSLF